MGSILLSQNHALGVKVGLHDAVFYGFPCKLRPKPKIAFSQLYCSERGSRPLDYVHNVILERKTVNYSYNIITNLQSMLKKIVMPTRKQCRKQGMFY